MPAAARASGVMRPWGWRRDGDGGLGVAEISGDGKRWQLSTTFQASWPPALTSKDTMPPPVRCWRASSCWGWDGETGIEHPGDFGVGLQPGGHQAGMNGHGPRRGASGFQALDQQSRH